MSLPNILLSIVIATKNREKYCIEAIKSILNINSENIEIAIADNSDTVQIKMFVENLNNNQIVYQYDSSAISSIDNFNKAMQLASGEYVCLIGDDDTVLPEIVHAVNWAKKNNVDSLNSSNYIHYYWPHAIESASNGLMLIPNFKPSLKKIDTPKELTKLIKNGIINYSFYLLPKTYHGIVKREIMMKIKSQTGHFYGGLSPDIYSVIATSCFAENHYSTTIPLTIAGVCATSTTADNFSGRHCGEIKDIPHLKNRGVYIWDKQIPEYYSVSTIWSESGLKALLELKQSKLYKKFSVYPLLAQGILMNRKYILKLMLQKTNLIQKEKRENKLLFWTKICAWTIVLILEKINRVLKQKTLKRVTRYENVTNIVDAIAIVKEIEFYKNNFEEIFNLNSNGNEVI